MRAAVRCGAALLFALWMSGCMATGGCRFGSDCTSGICQSNGACGESDAGPGADATAPTDGGVVEDAATERDGSLPSDGGSSDGGSSDGGSSDGGSSDGGSCDASRPDDAGGSACGEGDGRLSADELSLPLDITITRRVATDVSVDTRGTERADGTRRWDFEGPYAGDADVAFVRTSPSGTWFTSSFPTATYVLRLSSEEDLLGVFRLSADSLVLLGIVSPSAGATRTELTYAPPAPVWRFPLEVGASWAETSSVSGVARGVAVLYSERWSV